MTPRSLVLMAWVAATLAGPAFGPLPFFYDLYTFRGAGPGTTTVVAAFAVPAGALERESRDAESRYRFDVTLVLADAHMRSVFRTDDSVFVGMRRPLAGGHLLHTHIEVQAPPSASTLQRAILTDATTPGRGQLYESAFLIPDYNGTHLMLSDIALGQPDAQEGWTRGGVTVALLPTSQLPESAFDVYYEVYNLPAGTRYSTEIAIEEVGDSGESVPDEARSVQARFFGEAALGPDGFVQERRRVDASLAKGHYRLTVTVTDQDRGISVTGSRPFQVRGWDRGATLVQALPRRSVVERPSGR